MSMCLNMLEIPGRGSVPFSKLRKFWPQMDWVLTQAVVSFTVLSQTPSQSSYFHCVNDVYLFWIPDCF